MALNDNDLQEIRLILDEKLKDIKADIKEMKADVKLLATLNQLDEIKKEGRLRSLYID
jgi:hypothetical protein